MKLLYFGTLCNREAFEERQAKSRQKASAAPLNFESALLEGFAHHGAELEVFSFPMVASFPNSPLLCWGARREQVAGGYECTWLSAINLKGLKQLSQRLSVRKALKSIRKREVDAVLIYSVYAPVAEPVLKACRKHRIPCYCIVADLPKDMYENRKMGRLKKLLSGAYTQKAIKLQGSFNGYIYLTEAMSEAVAPGVPYIVVEGIADSMLLQPSAPVEKKKAVMYAGALNEKYGIGRLAEAFLSLNLPQWELWIFGEGDLSERFSELAKREDRIRYFGRVSREEVLHREKEAALLVNPRPTGELFTRYSFPSKTIEYMLSGTPVLMTRMEGIPKEYFSVSISGGEGSVPELSAALKSALELTDSERRLLGEKAKSFILDRAGAMGQSKRILNFIGK